MYGCIRHTHHIGIALFINSFGLLIGSFSFIVIFTLIYLFMIVIFVKKIEEKEAIKKFGNDYIQYKKKVPSFIPHLKCFRRNSK
ncbi:MAG: methyltransferase family protein [Candidatus Helarchaeota archaeon]